jgi:tetratricopeptide (TPR) repeat protein
MKLKAWRAFSRAVAALHRANVLRLDLDDMGHVVYDPATDQVEFGRRPSMDESLTYRAAPDELARNLTPLMQLVFAHRGGADPAAVWAEFEATYLAAMDDRGPQVMAHLRDFRQRLHQAAEMNVKALAQGHIGKADEARQTFEALIREREAIGDYEGYCGALCNLALLCADAGDLTSAHAAVARAIRVAREHGRRRAWSLALFQKGFLLKREGDLTAAARYADLAMHVWQRTGQPAPQQFIEMAATLKGDGPTGDDNPTRGQTLMAEN